MLLQILEELGLELGEVQLLRLVFLISDGLILDLGWCLRQGDLRLQLVLGTPEHHLELLL